jgi:DNA-binding SARP family transcriptional activator
MSTGVLDQRAMAASAGTVLVRLRLIGQMEAWSFTGESVLPTGRKTRALLAVLALSLPRPVLRARLAGLLWSRRPVEQARASLRQEIHRLGEALAPLSGQVLLVSRDQLTLAAGVLWVDVDEVLRATAGQPEALGLLDGALLEDLHGVDPAFDLWLAGERERLSDRARALAERVLDGQTEPEAIIAAATRLLAIDRAHEGGWRALMRAYAARGERGMVAATFERCRRALAERLGASPSAETERLLAELRPAAPVAAALPRAEVRVAARRESGAEAKPEVRVRPTRTGVHVGALPLLPIGPGAAKTGLASAISEEITAALTRCRTLAVASSGALARFAAQSRDETLIRRAFALDYLLDGSLQQAPGRLRVALRLLDLRAGNRVVWAQRFDHDDADVLALQDAVAAATAAQIEPEILLREAERNASRPPGEVGAPELVLRALPLLRRFDRETFVHAGLLLKQAATLDAVCAPAHAWGALWQVLRVEQGWADDASRAAAEAGRLAGRAVILDPQDARGLAIAGLVRALLHHRLREAVSLHEKALAFNPNLAMAWALAARTLAHLGRLDAAEQHLQRYRQLAPLDPFAPLFDATLPLLALLRHEHQEAARLGRAVAEISPVAVAPLKPYLAALGHLGANSEAARVRRRLAAIEPGFSIARFLAGPPWARPEDCTHYCTGLRLAGVAEN